MFTFTLCAFTLSGCATGANVFLDEPVIQTRDDRRDSPVPQKTDYDFVEDAVHSTGRLPVNEYLDFRRTPRSGDVNALDEVPASAWFTPRLGYKELAPADILKGPTQIGPPQLPMTVVKAKNSGNSPGFVIEDARGHTYLIKFDSDEFPGTQSTANLVSNRLFWAFGYNVPEDFLFRFKADDLNYKLKDADALQDAEFIMMTQTPNREGFYTTTASLYIQGEILGPTAQTGTRKGDINDTIAHEDLRSLRALKVFGALLDHTGMRSDNSLDVHVTENNKSYTKHYLLDFGETLGVHGLEKRRNWDSHEHFFSLKDSAYKYMTLGLKVQPWERLDGSPSDYSRAYHDENFEPLEWKETWQFQPIRQSQPDDDYWAAKILSALTEDHVKTLFEATGNEDQAYIDSLFRTLLNRKEAILNAVFQSVSPLEIKDINQNSVTLEDISAKVNPANLQRSYEIRFLNKKGKAVASPVRVQSKQGLLRISLPQTSDPYLQIHAAPVTAEGKTHKRPAEFHLSTASSGQTRVLGILH